MKSNQTTLTSHVQTTEKNRLTEAREAGVPWKKWGPYLSERQWGTVREDYSEDGNAWDYFTHDQARSRAYRWGEDGMAGISDDKQQLCFALALGTGARALDLFARSSAADWLQTSKGELAAEMTRAQVAGS
jgi:hypothetical protein